MIAQLKIPVRLGVVLALSTAALGSAAAPSPESVYNAYCIACHGAAMNQGLGGSLVDAEWKYAQTDAQIANLIRTGLPAKGMPAFGKMLDDAQVQGLVTLIRSKAESPAKTE